MLSKYQCQMSLKTKTSAGKISYQSILLILGVGAVCVGVLIFSTPKSVELSSAPQSELELISPIPNPDIVQDFALNNTAIIRDVREILVCEPSESQNSPADLFTAGAEKLGDQYIAFIEKISMAEDVESKVIAEVIAPSNDIDIHIDALNKLSESYPTNLLALSHLLSSCSNNPSHAACGERLIERAVAIDSDNSATWGLISNLRLSKGETLGAKIALENASSSSDYDDLSGKHLELVGGFSSREEGESLINNFGRNLYFSSSINTYSESLQSIGNFCNENAASDSGLADACIIFGGKIVDKSSSLAQLLFGVGIQESTYLALGDHESATTLLTQLEKTKDAISSQDNVKALALAEIDESLARSWINSFVINGELAASLYIVDEAKNLSSNPAYNPCVVND